MACIYADEPSVAATPLWISQDLVDKRSHPASRRSDAKVQAPDPWESPLGL
jgi:hypothetical protein